MLTLPSTHSTMQPPSFEKVRVQEKKLHVFGWGLVMRVPPIWQ